MSSSGKILLDQMVFITDDGPLVLAQATRHQLLEVIAWLIEAQSEDAVEAITYAGGDSADPDDE